MVSNARERVDGDGRGPDGGGGQQQRTLGMELRGQSAPQVNVSVRHGEALHHGTSKEAAGHQQITLTHLCVLGGQLGVDLALHHQELQQRVLQSRRARGNQVGESACTEEQQQKRWLAACRRLGLSLASTGSG